MAGSGLEQSCNIGLTRRDTRLFISTVNGTDHCLSKYLKYFITRISNFPGVSKQVNL